MRHSILYSIIIITLFACKKDSFDIVNLNNNRVAILGHAGMGIDKNYPMNSIESILACLSLDADGTEMDVQMTKDGVLVAYHDEHLETNTNGTGKIYEHNWSDISNLTFQYPPFTNYKLQKVEDILANIPNQDNYVFSFDCKNYKPDTTPDYHEQFETALFDLIDRFDLGSRCNFGNRRIDLLKSLKEARPSLNLYVYSHFERAMEVALTYDLKGIILPVTDITAEQVKFAHDNNIWVCVFNTHSKNKNIIAFQKNVDIVQTDKIKHALQVQQ
jgi:glycerophosphoryl diester phosphodiesterase